MWEGLFSNSLLFVIFPSHLLVSGFRFQPLNIGHMAKNGKKKTSTVKKKIKKKQIQSNKKYLLYKNK